MRLLSVGPRGAETPAMETDDGRVLDVSAVTSRFDADFWRRGGTALLSTESVLRDSPELDLSEQRLGAPVSRPGSLVCVGLNYRDHAAEANAPIPDEPVLFLKATNTLAGPFDPITRPAGSSKLDYEVELAVIVGRELTNAPDPRTAAAAVAGYAISHDISERAFQLEGSGQWTKGKSCRGFNPLGPYLLPAGEVPDSGDLTLWLTVNGEERQRSSTGHMIFDVAYLLWYVSQFMVLEPGDVINTGTPAGVGHGHRPPRYLRDGDVVELGGDRLGAQRQTVLAKAVTG